MLVDPLTRCNSAHPPNLALSSHAALDGPRGARGGIATAISLAVVLVLSRRVRAATPPARRQLGRCSTGARPPSCSSRSGSCSRRSRRSGSRGFGLALLAALALPFAFIGMLVQGRLSGGAVGELLPSCTTGTGARPGGRVTAGARRSLARLGHLRVEEGRYVDCLGVAGRLPGCRRHPGHDADPPPGRDGRRDRPRPLLAAAPELLDAVGAAAGFALANERAFRCRALGWRSATARCWTRSRHDAAPRPRRHVPRYPGRGRSPPCSCPRRRSSATTSATSCRPRSPTTAFACMERALECGQA